MKQRMRSLGRKLELATYAHDKVATFKLASKALVPEAATVSVPVPIMYRFYHVGRAYDLNQLKNLQPSGNAAVDFISIQLLIQELEQVSELIDDPVLRHYGEYSSPI